MIIKILGTGCAKCQKLYNAVEEAIRLTGVDAELVKVEELDEIVAYGVPFTPGLVIDDTVKSTGRVPKVKQIVQWLEAQA